MSMFWENSYSLCLMKFFNMTMVTWRCLSNRTNKVWRCLVFWTWLVFYGFRYVILSSDSRWATQNECNEITVYSFCLIYFVWTFSILLIIIYMLCFLILFIMIFSYFHLLVFLLTFLILIFLFLIFLFLL